MSCGTLASPCRTIKILTRFVYAVPLRAAPLTPWLGTMGLTPLYAAVLVGAAQNVFSKSAKYSLFDPCKEMAYIPLDQETQLKARALACLR